MQNGKKSMEEHTVFSGEKSVAVRNFTPVLSEPERIKTVKEINDTLYEVFSKYDSTDRTE